MQPLQRCVHRSHPCLESLLLIPEPIAGEPALFALEKELAQRREGDFGVGKDVQVIFTLQVRKRAARMGRNPATGEAIKIKASKKVAFRASKELKEAV